MPELPEVQTVVDTLRPLVEGRTVVRVDLRRRDILTPSDAPLEQLLTGRYIQKIARRGKRIVFALETGQSFYIHLGMSGRIAIRFPNEPLAPHTHLRIQFDADPPQELRLIDPRRFGGIWWLGDNAGADEKLGPEPLTIRATQLAHRLGKTQRAIKNALLDQSLIAGLGNIYVDESLFAARLHPLKFANTLTPNEIGRLSRAIKSTLKKALRHRGSTLRDYRDANGEAGGFQSLHRVYGREGQPCCKCRKAIQRIVLGGRSTHFCPRCQPQWQSLARPFASSPPRTTSVKEKTR